MQKGKIILVYGGGHCKSVIDVAECAGYTIHESLTDQKKSVNEPLIMRLSGKEWKLLKED